jgi:hypothetical protein
MYSILQVTALDKCNRFFCYYIHTENTEYYEKLLVSDCAVRKPSRWVVDSRIYFEILRMRCCPIRLVSRQSVCVSTYHRVIDYLVGREAFMIASASRVPAREG